MLGDQHRARLEDAALRRGGGQAWLWAAARAEAAADPPRTLPAETGSGKQKSPVS